MYSNQFQIEISGTFDEIVFDDYVEIAGEDRRKIQAIFLAKGDEEKSDFVQVTLWGKAADALSSIEEGAECQIDCKLFTREVEKKDKSGTLFITEVVGYFVKEKNKRQERERRANNTTTSRERTPSRQEPEKKNQRGRNGERKR